VENLFSAAEFAEFGSATPAQLQQKSRYPQPDELLQGLNPAQREAVLHGAGPAMIIAGAGSGKTKVLTQRLAYLVATHQATAWQLLALTFTNKAAREMRNRIEGVIGSEARNIAMGTFHSVFARILRVESTRLGYVSDFSIYDSDDAKNLVGRILKELNKDDKKYKPRAILSLISLAKNDLISPEKFAALVDDEYKEVAHQVYQIYQARLRQANAMDFDDLLYNTAVLLRDDQEVLVKYQQKWKFIMVDEYQDTNKAQYYITKKLAAFHENLTVVGDDAQSIYSFRGANIQNILNFRKDYPQLKLFKLEQNYRSTGTIVQAANGVIAQNLEQIPKTVFTANESGEKIRLLKTSNELEEALRVVDTIREQKAVHSLHNREFAVLYRTNAQSRNVEDALRRAGITYRIFGGQSFYGRKEIKDVLAYLKLAINPADEEALLRVINYPVRGIGDKTQQAILAAAADRQTTPWHIITHAEEFEQYLGRVRTPVVEFGNLIKGFQRLVARDTAQDVVAYVAKHSGILKDLHQENSTESLSRWENVQELVNAAQEFTERAQAEGKEGTLGEFLQEVLLMTDADTKNSEHGDNHVSLMTIHAAKGLEFKSVFITGLEENLFPSYMSTHERESLEEERRLFYVAITRAEKFLTLSFADTRLKFGSRERTEPSRFLEDIPKEFLLEQARRALENNGVVRRLNPDTDNQDANLRKAQEWLERQKAGRTGAPPRNVNAALTNSSLPSRPQPGPEATRLTPIRAAEASQRAAKPGSDDLSQLAPGVRIEHQKFGIGTVKDVKDDRLVVDFPGRPATTLLLKFARVRVLD
jgi:DNA helicase-2/ATP-dependent DNA helicase PcrA